MSFYRLPILAIFAATIRPQEGLINVSQQAMLDLQTRLHARQVATDRVTPPM